MTIHICTFSDPRDYRIRADGREYLFDFSDIFGPWVLRKDGRGEAKCQPGPRAEFWKAVTLWKQQGKRIGEDGLCLWDYPPKQEAYQLGPRTLISKEMYEKLRRENKIPELPVVFIEVAW